MTAYYNARDWFWLVGGDESKAWSSATGAYVSSWPQEQATRIANEIELYDVLARSRLGAKAPARTFSADEVRTALLRIDAVATGSAASAEELRAVADTMGVSLPPAIA